MTPAQAIAALDRQLAAHGQTVILRKGNTMAGQATVRAFVRGVTADDIVGNITQTDKKVTVSPTGLEAYGTPGSNTIAVIDGAPSNIIGKPEVIKINDIVVRINMMVKG